MLEMFAYTLARQYSGCSPMSGRQYSRFDAHRCSGSAYQHCGPKDFFCEFRVLHQRLAFCRSLRRSLHRVQAEKTNESDHVRSMAPFHSGGIERAQSLQTPTLPGRTMAQKIVHGLCRLSGRVLERVPAGVGLEGCSFFRPRNVFF